MKPIDPNGKSIDDSLDMIADCLDKILAEVIEIKKERLAARTPHLRIVEDGVPPVGGRTEDVPLEDGTGRVLRGTRTGTNVHGGPVYELEIVGEGQ